MSSPFPLNQSYFQRVEDVPEYVQQVSFSPDFSSTFMDLNHDVDRNSSIDNKTLTMQ